MNTENTSPTNSVTVNWRYVGAFLGLTFALTILLNLV